MASLTAPPPEMKSNVFAQCQTVISHTFATHPKSTEDSRVGYRACVLRLRWRILPVPAVNSVRELLVSLERDNLDTYATSGLLIRSATKVQRLTILSSHKTSSLSCGLGLPNAFHDLRVDAAEHEPLRLEHVQLYGIDFVLDPALDRYVKVASLRRLVLSGCPNIAPVLKSAASSVCNMKDPEIHESIDTEGETLALETLLNSFTGLKNLWLDTGKGGMIDLNFISQHGPILRQMAIVLTDCPHEPTVPELAITIATCPQLEGLAVEFCSVDVGDVHTLGSGFNLSDVHEVHNVPIQVEAFLDIIAKHPSLSALRMCSLPCIDYGRTPNPASTNGVSITDDEVHATGVILHRLASTIMQCLWSRGSHLKQFGISPSHNDRPAPPRADENGYRWPYYFHTRGRVLDPKAFEDLTALLLALTKDDCDSGYSVMHGRYSSVTEL
ncbi:hypothetical protein EK21DRAFT_93348 [Setomelanomma holmii]|uniref:Uncharacterized protein n=1 Tax=Setomelanomma holmii TaxID=210430 RepID=A0A9P4H0C7_9PLEO|nr:hypothetical protein EK21DRAFT_93348 [Setomelanomma holmii]